mmetsp:Transcript_947/g.2107  ORF Transcript_947/g.2107 Transcript_947/m.2107 type:complete len:105 (+) Transcript_947:91-405(+)
MLRHRYLLQVCSQWQATSAATCLWFGEKEHRINYESTPSAVRTLMPGGRFAHARISSRPIIVTSAAEGSNGSKKEKRHRAGAGQTASEGGVEYWGAVAAANTKR